MLEIFLNENEVDTNNFILSSLQFLPRLCLDPTTKLELDGIISRIVNKTKDKDIKLQGSILLENIEKLNQWYSNKEKNIYLKLTNSIVISLIMLLKEHLSSKEEIVVFTLQRQITSLFYEIYGYLYQNNEIRINPIKITSRLQEPLFLEEV